MRPTRTLRTALRLLGLTLLATALLAGPAGAASPTATAGDTLRTTDLGMLGGSEGSFAYAINDRGQIVGFSSVADWSLHAFLWQGGVMRDLGTLGGDFAWATGINEQGLIVGHSTTATGQERDFVWRHGVMTALPTLASSSEVWGVNDQGQVVGDSWAPAGMDGQPHAVLWS